MVGSSHHALGSTMIINVVNVKNRENKEVIIELVPSNSSADEVNNFAYRSFSVPRRAKNTYDGMLI